MKMVLIRNKPAAFSHDPETEHCYIFKHKRIPFLKNDTPVEEQADVELEEFKKKDTAYVYKVRPSFSDDISPSLTSLATSFI